MHKRRIFSELKSKAEKHFSRNKKLSIGLNSSKRNVSDLRNKSQFLSKDKNWQDDNNQRNPYYQKNQLFKDAD